MIDITQRIKDGFIRQVTRHKESKEYRTVILKAQQDREKLIEDIKKAK